jgi:hypothetical protein
MARGGPPKAMKTLRSRCGVRASALPPSFRSARNFTSAGSADDLVAGDPANRVFDRANSTVFAKMP